MNVKKSCIFSRTQFHTHKVTNEKSKLEDLSKVRLVTKKDDNKNTDDDYYEELLNEFKVKEILYTTSSESLSKTNNRTNHCDDTNIECEFNYRILLRRILKIYIK